MADQDALLRVLADYARTLTRDFAIGDVLYGLSANVVDVLGVDGAGVSLADGSGTLRYVTATEAGMSHAEQTQEETGEGPCHEAHVTGEVVVCEDLESESRWPAYRTSALQAGVRAVAGVPMRIDDQRLGAIDVYCKDPHRWCPDDLEVARVLADMAAGYIVNAGRLNASEQLSRQLQHALDSRVVIEQAKGVLAERKGLSPDQAFVRLRAHARSTNSRLHAVAEGVVAGTLEI